MPRDSKRVRQLRRLKRERTNALKMLDHVLIERNTYRQILMDARQKYIDAIITESQKNAAAQEQVIEGEVAPENREVTVPVDIKSAVYDPVNDPEGAALADAYLAKKNEDTRAE